MIRDARTIVLDCDDYAVCLTHQPDPRRAATVAQGIADQITQRSPQPGWAQRQGDALAAVEHDGFSHILELFHHLGDEGGQVSHFRRITRTTNPRE